MYAGAEEGADTLLSSIHIEAVFVVVFQYSIQYGNGIIPSDAVTLRDEEFSL
jgi:hypothetical protein